MSAMAAGADQLLGTSESALAIADDAVPQIGALRNTVVDEVRRSCASVYKATAPAR